MRKIGLFLTATLAAFSLLFLRGSARGDEVILFTGLTTPGGTYACGASPGTAGSTPCDLNGYYRVSVQISCTAGPCAGEVDVQQQNTSIDGFVTVIPVINPPAGAQQGFSNTGYGKIQVVVPALTSGTWQCTLVRLK